MIIYLTTNLVNGKKYIGLDSNNNPYYYGSGTIFKKALSKYGTKNFKKEILEYCKTKEELEDREIYWIEKYNAVESDEFYNIINGGNTSLGYKHTKEFIDSVTGRKLSKEHRQKLSDNHFDCSGENHPMYGKHHTNAARKIMSDKRKGKKPINVMKLVINLETGIYYESLKEAWLTYKGVSFSGFSANLNPKNKRKNKTKFILV